MPALAHHTTLVGVVHCDGGAQQRPAGDGLLQIGAGSTVGARRMANTNQMILQWKSQVHVPGHAHNQAVAVLASSLAAHGGSVSSPLPDAIEGMEKIHA